MASAPPGEPHGGELYVGSAHGGSAHVGSGGEAKVVGGERLRLLVKNETRSFLEYGMAGIVMLSRVLRRCRNVECRMSP